VVDLVAYLGRLLAEIATAHGLEGRPPVLRTEREPVWLDTDLAVPCGLIVHELVTNAIRHAYAGDPPPRPYGGEPEHAGRGAGPVDVTLEAADGALALSVHDAGVGLPEDASGIGSEIVRALARQLDGELRIESRPGDTTVAVRFPWAGRPSA